MDYKIIKADPLLGQITVNYHHDSRLLGTYTIDVPIENGKFVTGEKLEKEIQDRAPTFLIERQEGIAQASNFSSLEKLVIPPADIALPPVPAIEEVL
jgi:hypothetical protein